MTRIPTPHEPIRQISGPLVAARCQPRTFPRPSSVAARMGVSYEKKVHRALTATAKRIGAVFEPSPWFKFIDGFGQGQAALDGLFHVDGKTLVIEVKYTFTIDAVIKLRGLYLPVLGATLKTKLFPLIIVKNLTPNAMATVLKLSDALLLNAHVPTLQWLGHGPIDF